MKRKIKNNVYWVGKIDWEMETFHGSDYSINHGSSQNAYLIQEEKTVLIDTVWKPHATEFVENLEKEIDLQKIDFIVMHHGEIDHSGALPALMEKIPDTPIYCTANGVKSLVGQYHHPEWNFKVVKTGDSVEIGTGKNWSLWK
jgi:anaerobic nitric oxide reductase flavorubredoxin